MPVVAVAVVAVALVAVLAVVFTERDISVLVAQRRNDLARSPATDAVSTYNTGRPGWNSVDLRPALELAAGDGARAAVLDGRGKVAASTLATPPSVAGIVQRPLHLNGQRIGTLLVRFTGHGLAAEATNLRVSLIRAVLN